MSHSKRNTSRAVFTSYERDLARRAWGTASARLSRESFLPFASCGLCLSPATDPVACGARGDVFCRECALGNILAQRQEAKRAERARAVEEKDRLDAQAREDEEARARAVHDFEMTLHGLDGRSKTGAKTKKSETLAPGWGNHRNNSNNNNNNNNNNTTITGQRNNANAAEKDDNDRPYGNGTPNNPNDNDNNNNNQTKRPVKRKLSSLDTEELARVAAEEDRAKARRLLDTEKAEAASRAALPSFWTPSMTPAGTGHTRTKANANGQEQDNKQKKKTTTTKTSNSSNTTLPVCPCSRENDSHPYSLHTLVTINFTEEEGEEGKEGKEEEDGGANNKTTNQKSRVCPACRKGLSNASKAVLAKPCGHVLCRSCVDRFVRPGAADPHAAHASEAETPLLRCYVCEADLTDRPPKNDNSSSSSSTDKKKKKEKQEKEKEKIRPGLVELRSEGTGFSAGGSNEVKKSGIAFQC